MIDATNTYECKVGIVHCKGMPASLNPKTVTSPATAVPGIDSTPVILTGVAGFIGMHVALKLLQQGVPVWGIDHLGDYYDPALKRARLAALSACSGFHFQQADLADPHCLSASIAESGARRVIHLAAQPGVRHSVTHPQDYLQHNMLAFGHVLEACRHANIEHLVFASSSSVYGANRRSPYSERDSVDHPLNLYAASKKANELMAHSYAHLYGLPCTGLRFFTVYGPWGRPDMAPWLFTEAILAGRPIRVFNQGRSLRDFTYVDDAAGAVVALLQHSPAVDPGFDHAQPRPDRSHAPYRILNVGHAEPVRLLDFIDTLERLLGRKAIQQFEPAQPGDMDATAADVTALRQLLGFVPETSIEAGLRHWVDWYRKYAGFGHT